ncbi:MAG: hypothetical protein AAF183_18060 [Pseudomonadota bacterium]
MPALIAGVYVRWSTGDVSVEGGVDVPMFHISGPYESHVEAARWISSFFSTWDNPEAVERHSVQILEFYGA